MSCKHLASRQVVVDMQGYLEAADGAKGEPLPSVAGGENVEATAGMHRCARRCTWIAQ